MRIPFTQYHLNFPPYVVRHKWKFIIGALLFIFVVLPAFALTRPKQAQYVTAEVQRGTLTQTVEAVGTVTSEKDLELQFRTAGIVSSVNVKEGQKVRAGQTLASIRGGSFAAQVASANASLQEAQANLRALEEGSRPEDIAVEEASLANKKAQLQAAKDALKTAQDSQKTSEERLRALEAEAEVTRSGEISTVPSFLSLKISNADLALSSTLDLFLNPTLEYALTQSSNGLYQDTRVRIQNARTALATASNQQIFDLTGAIAALQKARIAADDAARALDGASQLLSNPQLQMHMSATTLADYRTSVTTFRTTAQTASSNISDQLSALQQTPASLQTRVSAEESSLATAKGTVQRAQSDILTYETAVRIGQAQLDLKRAGARQTDIDAARARVNYARASLSRAAADYADTLITAPVDGVVTKVSVTVGEITPVGAAIVMMGNSPYRIEMFASEIDVPKLSVTQTGSITLDAFRRTPFALRIGEIDQGPTDKDGVPKYKVTLDFIQAPEGLRIGMTGDAEIITGERADVLSVPRRAILDHASGSGTFVRVLKDGKVEERTVVMGMEAGSGDAEIISGLVEGETIVVLQK